MLSNEHTCKASDGVKKENKGNDKDLYLKTILSRLTIETGRTVLLNKKSPLVEMKIKVPDHIANTIINCTACYANPGNLETLFDVFCTGIFLEGIKISTMNMFKGMKQHSDFIETLDKKCLNCLRMKNENNI